MYSKEPFPPNNSQSLSKDAIQQCIHIIPGMSPRKKKKDLEGDKTAPITQDLKAQKNV